MNSKGNNTTSSHTTSSNIPSSHNNNETSFNINYLIRNVQSNQLNMIRQNSIHTKNLNSCVYYENINNTGKNILLIGESHLQDVDVDPIIHFFNSLIENKGDKCLDIFIENKIYFKPLKKNSLVLDENYENLLLKNNASLNKIKIFLAETIREGLRKHYIDFRDGFKYGFLGTVFYLIVTKVIDFSNNSENQPQHQQSRGTQVHPSLSMNGQPMNNLGNHSTTLYGQNKKYNILLFLLNLKNENGYKEGERLVFEKLKEDKIDFNKSLIKNIGDKKENIKELCGFITVNNINTIDEFYNKINEINKDIRSPLLNMIYNNKGYDDKINKQIDNIDTQYFTKEKLLNYYLSKVNFKFIDTLFDIIAIARMFRKFDFSKKRVPLCNNKTKSLKNIVLYSGSAHTDHIQTFIEKVILNDGGYLAYLRKSYHTWLRRLLLRAPLSATGHQEEGRRGGNYKKIDTDFIPLNFNYFNFFPNINNNLVLIDKIKKFNLPFKTDDIDRIVELLNRYGINNLYNNGKTVLMTACYFSSIDIVELLLNINGIDVNLQDKKGNTALMIACYKRRYKIVELLLNRNDINMEIKNKAGKTVHDIANEIDRGESILLLLFNKQRKDFLKNMGTI